MKKPMRGKRVTRREAVTDENYNAEDTDSPLLGLSKGMTPADEETLRRFVKESPVAVFRWLGREFNERGLYLSIGSRSEVH